MPVARPIITLLTDFGTADAYVAAMKGVILSIAPEARIVDITHEIPAHDVRSAAFVLWSSFSYFPPATIHVVVVDPGVGGARAPILVSTAGYSFIGPDNGVFSWILENDETWSCRILSNPRFRREPVNPTFHGRDIFAPAAANRARGAPPEEFGAPLEHPVRLELPRSRTSGPRAVTTPVVHLDRFGNVLLGITRVEFERFRSEAGGGSPRALVAPHARAAIEISGLRETYETAEAGRPFFIFGSSGFLEISIDRASASAATGLLPGDEVLIALV